MKEISLSAVKPGMVLSGSTYDLMGNLLFSEGTELSTATIRILQAWGVKTVQIKESIKVVAGSSAEGSFSSTAPLGRSQERSLPRKTRRLTRHITSADGIKNAGVHDSQIVEELKYRFALVSEDPLMSKIEKIAEEQLFLRMQAGEPGV